MHRFQRAGVKWWQKPLVNLDGRLLPAELAVLALELRVGEQGVWMNSRSTSSGVVELLVAQQDGERYFKTRRQRLPSFVSEALAGLYASTGLAKGCPDLVIWCSDPDRIRLVEVKCPHWDAPSIEQQQFMGAASDNGVTTTIVEWEFS